MMLTKLRLALAATLMALAAVSAAGSASARPGSIADGTSQTLMIGQR